jgi:hypothetical protein
MIAKNKPYLTRAGRVLSDADIDAIADEVAGDIDVETLRPLRRGRPKLDDGPAEVVAVRLDVGTCTSPDAQLKHFDRHDVPNDP